MDCARCEELLFASLEAEADRELADMRAHLLECERCRAFAALLATDDPRVAAPADLTESILTATSPRWALAFEQLDRRLPSLAVMQPDPSFVGDVLAATSAGLDARRTPATSRESGIRTQATSTSPKAPRRAFGDPIRTAARQHMPGARTRFAALWTALLRRPRLALEGAYIGALAVVLIFGVPSSPLHVSPLDALSELRDQRVEPALSAAAGQLVALAGGARDAVVGGAYGLWSNAVQPTFERGRAAWCETFACDDQPAVDDDGDALEQQPVNETRRNR